MTTNKVTDNLSTQTRDTIQCSHPLEKGRKLLHKYQRQEQEPGQGCVTQVIAREERKSRPRAEEEAVSVGIEVFFYCIFFHSFLALVP